MKPNTNLSIADMMKKGLSLDDFLVIDAHAHMGSSGNMHIPQAGAEGMVKLMDKLGIDSCCISHLMALYSDYRSGNQLLLEAARRYPGRFYPLVTVNPNYPHDAKSELERCFDQRAKGIKIHPEWHEYPLYGENYEIVWQFAAERQTFVLIHTWAGIIYRTGEASQCGPGLLDSVVDRFSKIPIILGHSGGTPRCYSEAIALAQKYPNVYLETC